MRLITTALVMLFVSAGAHAANFMPLGVISSGATGDRSSATGVSADGSVVVGTSWDSNRSNPKAFRWTSGVMSDLGSLPGGVAASASKVSADGSVVVGVSLADPVLYGTRTAYRSATSFRWAAGVMTGLWPASYAQGVSADGTAVVGLASGSAFRWTSANGIDLIVAPRSLANSISADGSVVVGQHNGMLDQYGYYYAGEAFRWTGDDGTVGLGDLPGGVSVHSSARAASADGAVVVGQGRRIHESNGFYSGEAFRWTSDGGMVGLGDLAGGSLNSIANDVSADGSIVVGQGNRMPSQNGFDVGEAFIWTADAGMQRLFDVLVARGATGLEGWTLTEANGISADGNWVVGSGLNPFGVQEAFRANLAVVPIPATGWLLGTSMFGLMIQLRRRRLLT